MHAIRLFRSERPHPQWIASVAICAAGRTVDHVFVDPDLGFLLGQLQQGPLTVARRHGLRASDLEPAALRDWHADSAELAGLAESDGFAQSLAVAPQRAQRAR